MTAAALARMPASSSCALRSKPENVVPRAHRHAAVDRHGSHRRVRKHEPRRRSRRPSSGTIGSKSWPSAPRPCSQITASCRRVAGRRFRSSIQHIISPCQFAHMAYYMRNFIHDRSPCRAQLSNKTSGVEPLPACSHEHVVNRQAELVELLRAEGYLATQSSVSRDLRDLGAAKLKNGYSLPKPAEIGDDESLHVVAEFVRDIRSAGPNLLVIITADRRGAARRGHARSHRLARDRRHGLRRRHHLRGDDRRERTTPAPRPVATTSEEGTDMTSASNPIVLAFSGGLDTSFCVPWLKETYNRPVVTVTVNCGGIDAAAARALDERARALGAADHRLDRSAAGVLRQGHQVPDHGQRAARQHVSALASAPSAACRRSTSRSSRRSSAPTPSRTAARRPATTKCGSRSC